MQRTSRSKPQSQLETSSYISHLRRLGPEPSRIGLPRDGSATALSSAMSACHCQVPHNSGLKAHFKLGNCFAVPQWPPHSVGPRGLGRWLRLVYGTLAEATVAFNEGGRRTDLGRARARLRQPLPSPSQVSSSAWSRSSPLGACDLFILKPRPRLGPNSPTQRKLGCCQLPGQVLKAPA
jgi:hypothetical protein